MARACSSAIYILAIIQLIGCNPAWKSRHPYMGIAVPGQTVDALDVFNLFQNSCKPKKRSDQVDIVGESINLLANAQGANLAQQMQQNLYYSIGDVDASKLMGKWYRIIDSPAVHQQTCIVSYYKMLYDSQYLSSFSIKDYYRNGDVVDIEQGHGSKIGPGPGQILINIADENERCPYTLVKVGPVNKNGQYSYAIWTQLLKYPVIGFARDPVEFDAFYKQEVEHFLKSNNYNNALIAAAGNRIAFMDFRKCPRDFYFDLD